MEDDVDNETHISDRRQNKFEEMNSDRESADLNVSSVENLDSGLMVRALRKASDKAVRTVLKMNLSPPWK